MQPPVSAKVTRERWRPPPESSFKVNFPSVLGGATPEKAHRMQQSGPGGAGFVTPLLPLTQCIATACPAAFASPRPVIWQNLSIVRSLLPYCLCLRRRAEGVSAELRKQASKQVTDAIVTPKNKGGEWTADAPSQAPYNFPFTL